MSRTTLIHRCEPDQWQRVRALRLRALLDAPDAFSSGHSETARLTERVWRERLAGPRAATFMASVDGRDAGLAVGAPYGDTDAAGLFSMWTAPEARRCGVALALLEAVVDWARAAAYRRMLIDVVDANRAAVALYARAGFVPDGVTGTLPPPREHVTEHRRERWL